MRKIGLVLGVLLVSILAGCGKAEKSEERKLPTLAPEVVESENENGESSGGGLSSLVSYVDQAKQAADENIAASTKSAIMVACVEAQIAGMEFPKEPIRFRYTKDLEELDGAYALLKEKIVDVLGEEGTELSVEGNYMMVEISADEGGKVEVKVTLMQE